MQVTSSFGYLGQLSHSWAITRLVTLHFICFVDHEVSFWLLEIIYWAHASQFACPGVVVLVDNEYMQVLDPEKSKETSRGFEPRSLDSESRVLTVTPRGQL